MSESYKDKLERVRDMARTLNEPSYFCIRKKDGNLTFAFGSMSYQVTCPAEQKLELACYYEIFDASGRRVEVCCNDFAALQELPADVLEGLYIPNAAFTASVEQSPQVFRGICTKPERERLWWEIERDEKRAAFERMIALRNDVRRICGQGGDA